VWHDLRRRLVEHVGQRPRPRDVRAIRDAGGSSTTGFAFAFRFADAFRFGIGLAFSFLRAIDLRRRDPNSRARALAAEHAAASPRFPCTSIGARPPTGCRPVPRSGPHLHLHSCGTAVDRRSGGLGRRRL